MQDIAKKPQKPIKLQLREKKNRKYNHINNIHIQTHAPNNKIKKERKKKSRISDTEREKESRPRRCERNRSGGSFRPPSTASHQSRGFGLLRQRWVACTAEMKPLLRMLMLTGGRDASTAAADALALPFPSSSSLSPPPLCLFDCLSVFHFRFIRRRLSTIRCRFLVYIILFITV